MKRSPAAVRPKQTTSHSMSTAEPASLRYGSFAALRDCSSASRPFCSCSSRVSREYHCLILFRALDDAASESQSLDGPRPTFDVRISTKSPFFSL